MKMAWLAIALCFLALVMPRAACADRYKCGEDTFLVCNLPPGLTVSVTFRDLDDDSTVDLADQCTGPGAPAPCCTGIDTGTCDLAAEVPAPPGSSPAVSSYKWRTTSIDPGFWPSSGRWIAQFVDAGGTQYCAQGLECGGYPSEIASLEARVPAAPADDATVAKAAALATVQADTDDLQARLPAALVAGRIDASVGDLPSATIALLFTRDSGETFGTSVAGSLVREVAGQAGNPWGVSIAGNTPAGSFGEAIDALVRRPSGGGPL